LTLGLTQRLGDGGARHVQHLEALVTPRAVFATDVVLNDLQRGEKFCRLSEQARMRLELLLAAVSAHAIEDAPELAGRYSGGMQRIALSIAGISRLRRLYPCSSVEVHW